MDKRLSRMISAESLPKAEDLELDEGEQQFAPVLPFDHASEVADAVGDANGGSRQTSDLEISSTPRVESASPVGQPEGGTLSDELSAPIA
eukprot:4392767-Prymnesium_polylepis.1